MSNRRNGGAPAGKMIEINGAEATGKTLLALSLCTNAQKAGGMCLYMDYEGTFNSEFAKTIGLDGNNNFIYCQPQTLEEGFTTIFSTLKALDEAEKKGRDPYPVVVIVFDSIAGAPCGEDILAENPNPTANVGLKPRILSKNISTLLRTTGRKKVLLVFLNQLRTNINAGYGGDKWIAPGGKAIPYAASVRLRVSTLSKIKSGDDVVGLETLVETKKCRFGPPFRKCKFNIFFNRGIDDVGSILDVLSASKGVVKSSGGPRGSLFHFKGEDKETALTKKEWVKKFKTDEVFKNRVLDLMETAMIKKTEVDDDTEVSKESGSEED
jgi:recombination protein RecA